MLSGVRAGNDTLGKELLPYLTTRTGTVAAWAAFYDRDRGAAALKGPKFEIFGSRVFTQLRPVWVVT